MSRVFLKRLNLVEKRASLLLKPTTLRSTPVMSQRSFSLAATTANRRLTTTKNWLAPASGPKKVQYSAPSPLFFCLFPLSPFALQVKRIYT
jgi:hypothetical protein